MDSICMMSRRPRSSPKQARESERRRICNLQCIRAETMHVFIAQPSSEIREMGGGVSGSSLTIRPACSHFCNLGVWICPCNTQT